MRYLTVVWLTGISLLLGGCAAAIVAGAGTAYIAAEDRRTVATMTEDESIELKTSQRVSEKVAGSHLNATSYNRMVLLTGEAPNDNARLEIERIARSVDNVRGVTNELSVGPPASMSSRANDSYVTSKVKARFVDASRFNPVHVKVVTENGTVFLLGLVKRQEAKDAIQVARTTEGVKKVVTVFEYLD